MNYFNVPALSKSQVKQWRPDNPIQFWRNCVFNPEYAPITPTDAMIRGQLIHLIVLEPHRFEEEYEINDKLGKSRTNVKWQDAQDATDKTIITTS